MVVNTNSETTIDLKPAPQEAAGLGDESVNGEDVSELHGRVDEVIELIRPAIQMDGGDISLIGADENGTVTVALHGACVGCPSSLLTLKAGVERVLKDRVPEVTELITLD